jgi:hypothetical protein
VKFFAFFFTIGQVTWNNYTTYEIPRISPSGRSPRTIRPLLKIFTLFLPSGRSSGTIRPFFAKKKKQKGKKAKEKKLKGFHAFFFTNLPYKSKRK